MTNFASTISVGVRTGDALTQLKLLQAELAKVTEAAQRLSGVGAKKTSSRGIDHEARTLAQALKTTARDIEQSQGAIATSIERSSSRTTKALQRTSAAAQDFQVRFSQSLGSGLAASTKVGLETTVKEVEQMANRLSAHEVAQANFRASQAQAFNKQLFQENDKARKAELKSLKADIIARSEEERRNNAIRLKDARDANRALVTAQRESRKQELRALRHDIEERSREERAQALNRQRMAREANRNLVRAEQEARAQQLRTLRHDIEERSKEERRAGAIRHRDAVNTNRLLVKTEAEGRAAELRLLKAAILERHNEERKQALVRQRLAREANRAEVTANQQRRAAELKALRAAITERSLLEQRGLERRRATQNRQLQLTDQYHKKDLAQRVKHLQQVQRIIQAEAALPAASRRSTATLARTFGITVMRNLGNLPEMERQLEVLTTGHKRLSAAVPNSTSALKANAAAMRDVHAVARGLSGSLGALWMTYGNLAPLMTAAALGTVARSTYQVGKDLEYRLRFVEALGNRPIQTDEMMPQVLGSMKTPLEAAEALQALSQAGMNAEQSLATLGATMRLSTLGELDMTEAALAMTGTIAAFQLGAEQADRVGDVFAKAAATSNTSVAKITESMRQASTAAAQYNVSVEEVSAALAVMAKNNVTGSMAGTSYRNMLKELYTPIARGAKAMKDLGLSAYNADNTMKPLSQLLVEMRDRLAGMNEESRNAALEAIFGERSGRAIRPILQDLDSYLDKIGELEEATGFLSAANEKLIDTVEGASNRLSSTLQQSYAKALDGGSENLKILIWELDAMVASEGFVDGLQKYISVLVGIAEAAVRAAPTLKTLALAYGAARVAAMSMASASNLLVRANTLQTESNRRSTESLIQYTNALRTNTAQQLANNVGRSAGITSNVDGPTMKRVADFGGKAAAGLARLTPILGWVALGYSAVSAALEYYERRANNAAHETDNLIERMRRSNASLGRQLDEMNKSIARRLEGAGSDDLLENVQEQRKREFDERIAHLQEVYKFTGYELDSLREQKKLADENARIGKRALEYAAERTQQYGEGVELTSQQIGINQAIAAAEKRRLELQSQITALTAEQREELEKIQKLQLAFDQAQSLNEFDRALQPLIQAEREYERLRAKVDSKTASSQDLARYRELEKATRGGTLVQSFRDQAQGKINAGEVLSGQYLHGVRVHGELSLADYNKMLESWSAGSGGSGSREFISNASLIKQQYDREKSMFASIRDMQIKGIRDLEAVGRYSTEEAAQKRREIWQTYVEDTAAAAAVAADKIRAVDPGSDYLKELSAQGVLRDAEHQKVLAQFEERKRIAEEAIRIEVEAEQARINLAGDLGKIREKIAQDEKKQAFERSKQYMTDAEISGIEARERAEREYNRAIAKQIELWEELVAIKQGDVAAAHSDPTGQNIQYTLTELQKAQADAGAKAYAQGVSNYMRDQTIAAGAQRAFTHYQNEALKTGDVIERAFIDTFDAMGSGLAEMVATGKANFRSLTVSVLENLSKMAMQAALNPLFGMIIKMGTSFISGGMGAPDTSYAPDVSAFFPSAKGNVFTAGQVQKFAKGGVFTNKIVSQPTLAPMALFGEAPGESEAIMPLARTSSGHLGVRAIPVGAQGTGGGNVFYMTTNVHVDAQGNATSNTQADENLLSQFGNQLNNQIKDVIRREIGQGGLIRRALNSAG